jgi:hypothetical protein
MSWQKYKEIEDYERRRSLEAERAGIAPDNSDANAERLCRFASRFGITPTSLTSHTKAWNIGSTYSLPGSRLD